MSVKNWVREKSVIIITDEAIGHNYHGNNFHANVREKNVCGIKVRE